MATLTTRFNVGEKVFILAAAAELNEADEGVTELLKNILSGVGTFDIKNIILDKNGIWYSGIDKWGDNKRYQESQLFVSEKEVVSKIVTDLKNHLVENLETTKDLIKVLEENYDDIRQECLK